MKAHDGMRFSGVLPLPAFLFHPITAMVIAAVHVYLGSGHFLKLVSGDVQWTHIWKGFGALAGAYVFAALASRGLAQHKHQRLVSGAMLLTVKLLKIKPISGMVSWNDDATKESIP